MIILGELIKIRGSDNYSDTGGQHPFTLEIDKTILRV